MKYLTHVISKKTERTQKESSPVGEHLAHSHHRFKEENVNAFDKDSRWFQRGVKEAIHIAANNPTSLNRDRGRHHLPAVYNSLDKTYCCESTHGGTLWPTSASGNTSVDKATERSSKSSTRELHFLLGDVLNQW